MLVLHTLAPHHFLATQLRFPHSIDSRFTFYMHCNQAKHSSNFVFPKIPTAIPLIIIFLSTLLGLMSAPGWLQVAQRAIEIAVIDRNSGNVAAAEASAILKNNFALLNPRELDSRIAQTRFEENRLGSDLHLSKLLSVVEDRYTRIISFQELQDFTRFDASTTGVFLSEAANHRPILVGHLGRVDVGVLPVGASVLRIGGRVTSTIYDAAEALARQPKPITLTVATEPANLANAAAVSPSLPDLTPQRDVVLRASGDIGGGTVAVWGRLLESGSRRLGYIRVQSFDAFAADAVGQAAAAMRADARGGLLSGWVLDLRGNGGGLVRTAQQLAWLTMGPNAPLLEAFDAKGHHDTLFATPPLSCLRPAADDSVAAAAGLAPRPAWCDESAGGGGLLGGVPVVVALDGGSASASESLASALRASGRGLLVGQATRGKAVIQQVFPLSGGEAISVSIARVLGPSGEDWKSTGLRPDLSSLLLPPPDLARCSIQPARAAAAAIWTHVLDDALAARDAAAAEQSAETSLKSLGRQREEWPAVAGAEAARLLCPTWWACGWSSEGL